MRDSRTLTLLVVPDGGNETRTFRISYGRLRIFGLVALGAIFVLSAMVGSWWYLAARAQRAVQLEQEVASFAEDRARIELLSATLAEVEAGYEHLRSLFGSGTEGRATEVWLPPAAGRASGGGAVEGVEATLPTSWPLAERGFITQGLLEGGGFDHPGLDIAVPTGSYVRAAGGGVVLEAEEDPVYGQFILLDHGDGYRSLYAHASVLFVRVGDPIRRNEIIALSGSTGRSTAPHLHFEILRDDEPVDPLTMVQQP